MKIAIAPNAFNGSLTAAEAAAWRLPAATATLHPQGESPKAQSTFAKYAIPADSPT